MRVLYDISTLGLAHLYRQSRGGSYRVDLHITEALAASGECELLFCANHSTVAYHGCLAFLAGHQPLRRVPMVAPRRRLAPPAVRAAATTVHRSVRHLCGSNVLPSAVRQCAAFLDKRLHPPVADAASAVDIFHSPSVPLPDRAKGHSPQRFLTIYDLAYVRFPTMYGPAYQRCSIAALRSVCREDSIITSSTFVRDELCEQGVTSADRIHVVPLAADPALFYQCGDADAIATVRRRYGVPAGPYVLSVNSPDPRKNVPDAVHAFGRAAHEGRDVLTSLVLTGNPGPGSDGIQKTIAAYPALRNRIILTGYIPDEDLAPLYTGAQVFVYPSMYEGFGLPPLEAMQCGTPVITSNASSLPEVVGDGGVMVAPNDVDGLAGAMIDLARDAALRERVRQRALARARRFSWACSTTATLRAYRSALHEC
jgi:glycosyltransferase involved in cell wall biosynthesis